MIARFNLEMQMFKERCNLELAEAMVRAKTDKLAPTPVVFSLDELQTAADFIGTCSK